MTEFFIFWAMILATFVTVKLLRISIDIAPWAMASAILGAFSLGCIVVAGAKISDSVLKEKEFGRQESEKAVRVFVSGLEQEKMRLASGQDVPLQYLDTIEKICPDNVAAGKDKTP
jgi:hypothetical protein